MKFNFGIFCLLCVCMVSSCTKNSDTTTDPIQYPGITAISPQKATVGDTLTVTGTAFGTDASKVRVFFDYTGDSGVTPIKVTPTQLSVVVPKRSSTHLIPDPATCYMGIGVAGEDTLPGLSTFTYLYPAIFYEFSGKSARPGELIALNGPFYDNQNIDSMRVRFKGSNQWINPIPGSDGTSHNVREGYFYYPNILIRVPADAQSGPIEVASDLLEPGKTDSSLTILPPFPDLKPGVWTPLGDLTFVGNYLSGKTEAATFTVNNRAYIATGNTGAPLDGYGTIDVWEFDPQYTAWRPMADFPAGHRTGSSAFAIGSKGYLCAGFDKNGAPTNDFYEFDPAKNTWTKKADFPGKARARAVGFSVGNLGYVGAGQDNSSTALSDFYQYDPTSDTWTTATSIPVGRSAAFAFVIDDKAYIGCGWNNGPNNSKIGLTDMYMFDPAAKTWTARTPLTGYGYTALNASFSLNGKGYVGLGYYVNAGISWYGTKKVYAYTPSSDSWIAIPDFGGTERTGAVGFAIGNTGYFSHGYAIGGTNAFKDTWAYKPN